MIYKGTDTVLKYSAKATACPWIVLKRLSIEMSDIFLSLDS